jgi:addiction module HigA family antidote
MISKMHNPSPPGDLLAGWLNDLNVSVTAFAKHIGISRVMLSRLIHGHAAISADMDLRLSEALGTSQGFWLALQNQRDLWQAIETAKMRAPIKPVTAAIQPTPSS